MGEHADFDFSKLLDEPEARRREDDGYEIPDVEVVRVTDNALLVRGRGLSTDPFGLEDPNEEAWIPRSQVHRRSGVTADAEPGDSGDLVITTWLAERRGLC